MSTTTPNRVKPPLEPVYGLDELSAAGYGHRVTLARKIRDGEIPAVLVGNRYAVRASDLSLLARPVGGDAA